MEMAGGLRQTSTGKPRGSRVFRLGSTGPRISGCSSVTRRSDGLTSTTWIESMFRQIVLDHLATRSIPRT